MNIEQLQPYLIPAALIAFFGWRFLKFRSARRQIPGLLQQGGVIVNVGTWRNASV